jgi:hypothetical protein
MRSTSPSFGRCDRGAVVDGSDGMPWDNAVVGEAMGPLDWPETSKFGTTVAIRSNFHGMRKT